MRWCRKLTGLAEAGDALLQKLKRQMGLIGCQSLADGDDEEGVVGWDAQAGRLQQLALNLQVEGASQSAQQIVSCRSECGTRDRSEK